MSPLDWSIRPRRPGPARRRKLEIEILRRDVAPFAPHFEFGYDDEDDDESGCYFAIFYSPSAKVEILFAKETTRYGY